LLTWPETLTHPLVIAEVAQTHDGSLGTAHAYIDAVARAGADAVKFQTHIAEAESTPDEPWRVRFAVQDERRFDYWKRMEFTAAQWAGLAARAQDAGLLFLSSAFSLEAVEMLDRIGMPAWKVGSGEITNLPMIERMAQTRRPVLLSGGLASWSDLDTAVTTVRKYGAPVAVLQCTTAYPCPPDRIGLNMIREIRDRYDCPAGLSDHSGTIYSGLAAAALGAQIIEVHVCFSRECFGPDVPASITTPELKQLTEGVSFISRVVSNPNSKDELAEDAVELRRMFSKSVVALRDLPAGWTVQRADLAFRKPGTGISVSRVSEVVDRRLRRPVQANTILMEEDLE